MSRNCSLESYHFLEDVWRLLFQNGLRSNLRASKFQKFPRGACPQTPPQCYMLMKLCILACTHPCNPRSENPGYGPAWSHIMAYNSKHVYTQPCTHTHTHTHTHICTHKHTSTHTRNLGTCWSRGQKSNIINTAVYLSFHSCTICK